MSIRGDYFKKSKSCYNLLESVLLYSILIFSSGFFFHEHRIAFTGPLITSCAFFVIKRNRIVERKLLTIVLILLVNSILSSVIAGDSSTTIIFECFAIITAFMVVASFRKEKFLAAYINLIFVLALGSVVLFVGSLFFSDIVRILPRLYDTHGTAGYYALFSTITLKTNWVAARNASIFWEPGVFQTFLILAFVFEISKYGNKRKLYCLVFTISLITTMSTTGYIALFIVAAVWINEVNTGKRTKLLRVLFAACLLFSFGYLVFQWLPKGLVNNTFDKVRDLINGDVQSNISVQVRYESVLSPFYNFLSSPIWGVGAKGMQGGVISTEHTMRTFTPLNWFARFGIVFGFIANMGFMQMSEALFIKRIDDILIRLTFLLIISTEAYTVNAAILIFVLWGYCKKAKY